MDNGALPVMLVPSVFSCLLHFGLCTSHRARKIQKLPSSKEHTFYCLCFAEDRLKQMNRECVSPRTDEECSARVARDSGFSFLLPDLVKISRFATTVNGITFCEISCSHSGELADGGLCVGASCSLVEVADVLNVLTASFDRAKRMDEASFSETSV
jgi:hypothetical protein